MRTLNGIVIKQRSFGENDKFADILTENGIIEIPVKGVKKINSKNSCSAQLFAYSRFCIDERNGRKFLNSAEPIHIFYGLRDNLEKLSLASYFADLLKYCITEETRNDNILRLFLNTLYFLEKNLKSCMFLKSVFELRLVSEIGLMPDILACRNCGSFEPEEIYFSFTKSNFCCMECHIKNPENESGIKANLPLLKAIRHIILSDLNRLFSFKISERIQETLSYLSEQYIISHFERSFSTLEFYKSIKDMKI